MGVYRNFSETCQSSLSDCLRHRRFADDKNIFADSFVPNFLKFGKRQRIFVPVAEFFSVNAVSDIKRIKSRLGIDFKNFCVGVKNFCFDESRSVQNIFVAFVEKIPTAKTVAHMNVDDSERSQHCFLVGILES